MIESLPQQVYLVQTVTYRTAQSNSQADYAAVQARCWNPSGNELARNLSGNIRPQSSQLAEPLWTDPGIKRGSIVRELMSTSNKQTKNAREEKATTKQLTPASAVGLYTIQYNTTLSPSDKCTWDVLWYQAYSYTYSHQSHKKSN